MSNLHLVVHCQKSPYDVYIGRPSKYGNPFSHKEKSLAQFQVESRQEAIEKYEQWIQTQPELIADVKQNLKGKILGCWCRPASCHGDILARIANEL